jgi:ATP-dependent DNA helicase PIF1
MTKDLNDEQLKVFEQVVSEKRNIYLTGLAGTGKTHLLKKIIATYDESDIGVTGMTGPAAILLNGTTLHSYLDIGIGTKPIQELTKRCKPSVRKKLKMVKTLIVDEVSMLNADLFEKVSDYLKRIRRNENEFGGVQMLFCGDFYQLPPISGKYCFESHLWEKVIERQIELKINMRQQGDEVFQKILYDARHGTCTEETIRVLDGMKGVKKSHKKGIKPTVILPRNREVDMINKKNMERLMQKGLEMRNYEATATKNGKGLMKSKGIVEAVELCVGCQVILTFNVNIEGHLVNGSRGVVKTLLNNGVEVEFKNGAEFITYVEVKDEETKSVFTYLPLKLAYALTIHKCQGMTIDCMKIDIGDSIFEYNQAYTALSRGRDLESIEIIDFSRNSFRVHPSLTSLSSKTYEID